MESGKEQLIKTANDLLLDKFKKGSHHVSSALRCGEKIYTGIHLDSEGFDICAEPIAIASAILSGAHQFDEIVTIWWDGDSSKSPIIIPPCGDCRQLLIKFAPSITILLDENNRLISPTIDELLPYSYSKPLS